MKPAATSLAVATLLRLADQDLRDAAVLESGRNAGNSPLLAGQAVRRLVDAVAATETGWAGRAGAELADIPDQNPVKPRLAALLDRLPLVAAGQPSRDGAAPPAPDMASLRPGLAEARALLKDLAARLAVNLLGDAPAGDVAPLRPPVVPKPTKAPPAPRPSATPARPIQPAPSVSPAAPPEVEGRTPLAVHARAGGVSSAAFWALMDRWGVADMEALDLVRHPGGLTKKGTRPRFKLSGNEVEMFGGLAEIDAALPPLQLDPRSWLRRAIKDAPFAGATPLAFLTQEGPAGTRSALRFLMQHGLAMSVTATRSP